jgi:predicted aminopeptidase
VTRLVLSLLAIITGCSTLGGVGYVVRAGWSEARLLMRRQPIDALLLRNDLEPDLRNRLELTLAVRAFAEGSLGLRVGDSYASFAEVDGDASVYVLSAAPRDRLAAHTWWYPIVGRVPYRGFFAREAALAAGADLARRGFDTDVRPAIAFSTLGWFGDPLLSTVAEAPPVALAETVLHELFHATVYVPGKAAFNESAATFAGHRGAAAFFCAGPGKDADRCAEARRRWTVLRARGRVLGRLAGKLRRLYASKTAPERRERARLRLAEHAAEVLTRRKLGAASEVLPPNNARLLGEIIYLTDLEAFDALAADDAGLAPALAALAGARGMPDPFAVVRTLARAPRGTAGG